jgi:hypothetical protein
MDLREEKLTHLGHLAEALKRDAFTVELVNTASKQPYLKIANAETPTLNERVQCEQAEDGSWLFWWLWKQPIGPVDDLETVIGKLTEVLRSVSEA